MNLPNSDLNVILHLVDGVIHYQVLDEALHPLWNHTDHRGELKPVMLDLLRIILSQHTRRNP